MAKDQLRPRLCRMLKGESGYGFHLHGEKGKSGQFIRKVEPGSPAEAAGLRAGDRVVEVNGFNVEQETHHQGSARVMQSVVERNGETRALFPALLWVFLAAMGELRLLVQPGVWEDALKSPDKAVQMFGGWAGQRAIGGLGGESWLFLTTLGLGRSEGAVSLLSNRSSDLNGQKELCPRLCHLKKGPNGYGFNLHSEKSRPGQFIRSVDPDSPASRAGLRPQDRLVEVNGINVEGLRHSEVVSHIKSRDSEARLLVVDPETDEYFKKLGVTPTEEHTKGVVPQPMTNGSAQTQLNGGSTSSSHSDLQSPGKESEDGDTDKKDPFEESGLSLSPTAAEAKEKVRAKRVKKRAPQMDWNKKREIFSNF
ncbi:NHRF2 protein, partial [Leiothrix lutea]|nr:NHRF2 protein [Leiothrix lutea]